jgi:ABC-2 type transport system permease protein
VATAHVPTHARVARHAEANALDLGWEMRTLGMVWKRELLRNARAPARLLGQFVQPLLYLFVFGYGLGSLVGSTAGFDFRKFLFPGVVAMNVVTTGMFSGVSVVWDREFGFLREMLVAPVSRATLVFGKTAGGATIAMLQAAFMLLLAPVIGVALTPSGVVEVLLLAALLSVALTAFGVFLASRMKRMENFQVVMQFLLMPMIFLSGTMYPLQGLPGWLDAAAHLDPLTYGVDPLRRIMVTSGAPPAVLARFGSGVELFGSPLAIWQELLVLGAFAAVFLALSIQAFGRVE